LPDTGWYLPFVLLSGAKRYFEKGCVLPGDPHLGQDQSYTYGYGVKKLCPNPGTTQDTSK